jgi:hypothetical protein
VFPAATLLAINIKGDILRIVRKKPPGYEDLGRTFAKRNKPPLQKSAQLLRIRLTAIDFASGI